MNDSTKKLFDAPWEAVKDPKNEGEYFVLSDTRYPIATRVPEKDAQRLARLPELYEALASVMYEGCNNCLTAHRSDIDPTFDFFMDHGCPLDHGDCPLGKHWTTLRKVRNGV